MDNDDDDDGNNYTNERNIVIYNNTSNQQQHRNTVGLSAQPHWANLFNYVRTVALFFTFFELIAAFLLAPLTSPTHNEQ